MLGQSGGDDIGLVASVIQHVWMPGEPAVSRYLIYLYSFGGATLCTSSNWRRLCIMNPRLSVGLIQLGLPSWRIYRNYAPRAVVYISLGGIILCNNQYNQQDSKQQNTIEVMRVWAGRLYWFRFICLVHVFGDSTRSAVSLREMENIIMHMPNHKAYWAVPFQGFGILLGWSGRMSYSGY